MSAADAPTSPPSRNVSEIIRFTPGVQIRNSGGPGQSTSMRIRGLRSDALSDTLEGVEVAAKRGTRQVAFAVIATTAVLVSVFLPVGFMEGNTGRMFRELSIVMAAAVALSAFVALTLTPMMCAKLIRPHKPGEGEGVAVTRWANRHINRMGASYGRAIARLVALPATGIAGLVLAAMVACVVAVVVLYLRVPSELAPAEDRGRFFIQVDGPEGAGYDYTVGQMQRIESLLLPMTGEGQDIQRLNSRAPRGWGGGQDMHTGMFIVFLEPWGSRGKSTDEIVGDVRKQVSGLPGVQVQVRTPGGLVGGRGAGRFSMVLGGPNYEELAQWRDRMIARMDDYPGLIDADSDYKETRPQMRVKIAHQRAADLGVPLSQIGATLETMMGGRRVTTFVEDGEEYDVIVQSARENRMTPADLASIQVRGREGAMIPLSNLVTLEEIAESGSFNRFNRLRAITIGATVAPGHTMGDAMAWAEATAREELPGYAQVDWKGEARQLREAGSSTMLTFAMALLIVYLVLAAQFESFVHPLVIMLTVPLAVLGALLGIWLTGGTLNLFSQIGIVMLIGLAAKNGILIVEFANQLRDEGRDVRAAIAESSAVRLRPILMTSLAFIRSMSRARWDGEGGMPGFGSRAPTSSSPNPAAAASTPRPWSSKRPTSRAASTKTSGSQTGSSSPSRSTTRESRPTRCPRTTAICCGAGSSTSRRRRPSSAT